MKVFIKLNDFYFKNGHGEFISVDGHSDKWAKETSSELLVFPKNSFKKDDKYLLQNF